MAIGLLKTRYSTQYVNDGIRNTVSDTQYHVWYVYAEKL